MTRILVLTFPRLHSFHWLLSNAIISACPIAVKRISAYHDVIKPKYLLGRDTKGLVVIGHHARKFLDRCGAKPEQFERSVYIAASDPIMFQSNLRACKGFDTVITVQNEGLEAYRRLVPKVVGSYLCAEPRLFEGIEPTGEYDVGMVATFSKSPVYMKRLEWLNRLRADGFKVLARQGFFLRDYAELLCKCKIGLQLANRGFRGIPHFPPAMRVFETLCAPGVMLICDKFDLNGLDLVAGEHYDVFPSGDYEATKQKIEYYLEHEEERRRIADAGEQWIKNRHTYDDRAKMIVQELGLKPKE